MKCNEIVRKMMSHLPLASNLFGVPVNISAVDRVSSLVARITTSAPHGLVNGEPVLIEGIPVSINLETMVLTGTEIAFTTLVDHDLTLNESEPEQFVEISSFSGVYSFKLIAVPNRFNFTVEIMAQVEPVLPAFLENVYQWGYNVLSPVTVLNATQFTYPMNFAVGGTVQPNQLDQTILQTKLRITGAVDIDTFLNSYTKEGIDKLWCCAVLDDYIANKDRLNTNDAFSAQGRRGDFYQQVIGNFSVYVVVPNNGEILTKTNGRFARDLIEDLRLPLFRSLLAYNFPTQLSCQTEAVTVFAGDGAYQYTGAYYVHRFQFQQAFDVTYDDTNFATISRAFRDIDLSITNEGFTTAYTAMINLDDEPVDQQGGFGGNFGIFG